MRRAVWWVWACAACQIELNPDFVEGDGTGSATGTDTDTGGMPTGAMTLPGDDGDDATVGESQESGPDGGSDSAVDDSTAGDGSATASDANGSASDTGVPGEHRVFISSTFHNGAIGSVAAADAQCQLLADNAGLGGTFVAIMSETGNAAVDRIQIDGPVRNMENMIIAQDEGDLWDGLIDDNIGITELGTADANGAVWTGTLVDGTAAPDNCSNWTDAAAQGNGHRGLKAEVDERWIAIGTDLCNKNFHIYCIEQ